MAYSRGGRRRFILVVLLLTAVTLITLDQRGGGEGIVGTVRNSARDALAPVQDAAAKVLRPIGDWFDGITSAGKLNRENERLKRDLEAARGEATQSEADREENQRLREQLGLNWIGDIPTVPAEVVAQSVGNFESTVQINRGTENGVAIGMPVVAGDGLVGKVTQASAKRATVQLIIDASFGVGARLVDDRTAANAQGAIVVARGTGNPDEMRLDFVNTDVTVSELELVVTSGIDESIFPSNLPIGRVTRAQPQPAEGQQRVLVEPLVDFRRLQFVQVLQWPLVNG